MDDVLNILKKAKKPISLEKIYNKLSQVCDINLNELEAKLNDMVDDNLIYKTPKDNYVLFSKTSFKVGYFKVNKDFSGVVSIDGNDYLIDRNDCGDAVDGDKVIIDTSNNHNRCISVIKRSFDKVVGEIKKDGGSYYVVPENERYKHIIIKLPNGSYTPSMKVYVKLSEKMDGNFYLGNVINYIGFAEDKGTLEKVIAYSHGVNDEFSDDVKEEVSNIPQIVLPDEMFGRVDLRDKKIFTIDGDDTRDFDDAVSLDSLDGGGFRLGVHIADVSHYVKYDSALYERALDQGCSTYLDNKVIPMLPPELSNGICSLNPNEDRLTLSVFIDYDKDGNFLKSQLVPSVINSKMRMYYSGVNNFLSGKECDNRYNCFGRTLKNMDLLAYLLQKKRILNGATYLNRDEIKLDVSPDGTVNGFLRKSEGRGENIISEFMIEANSAIARLMQKNGLPSLYRVHDAPDVRKVKDFVMLLGNLNYNDDFIYDNPYVISEIAIYLDGLKDDPLCDTLKYQLLRTMKKARYSDSNSGHFGLANPCYTHFTSPIRRVSDLTLHMLLHDYVIDKDITKEKNNMWNDSLSYIASRASEREVEEKDCEREVFHLKCAEYMKNHVGESFNGTVSSIGSDGMSVVLDNGAEGRVRLKELHGKYYYDSSSYALISLDNRINFYLGDVLSLKCSDTSIELGEAYFDVNSKIRENTRISEKVSSSSKVKKKTNKEYDMYLDVKNLRR